MDINLSDSDILAIGKRYFELASGKDEPKEAPKLDTEEDIIKKAKDIKAFCNSRKCLGCRFFLRDPEQRCILDGTPEDWEV